MLPQILFIARLVSSSVVNGDGRSSYSAFGEIDCEARQVTIIVDHSYIYEMLNFLRFIILSLIFSASPILAQSPTCPYPVIMLHGWTGSNESWDDFYQDSRIENIYGNFDENDQVFWAMPNATYTHDYYTDCCTFLCFFDCEYPVDSTLNDDIKGPDGIFNNNATDDDVQWVFPNENNQLIPGCLYAYSFNVGKESNGDIFKNASITSTAPCDDCSDNNEAATYKQGYALKRVIEAVLAANPTKGKVVLAAHSMGGLCAREYLQRRDSNGNPQWWVDSTITDGHKVAKLLTLGTPHRGSNTFGNISFNETSSRNGLPDFQSEGLRDLRYSYEDGSLANDIPGTYLYGGLESDVSTFLFGYWSSDVNCDGDNDDQITGINIDGLDQSRPDTWDGTIDNPLMPLPTNIKYTYYVSDADVAVDERRQWLFLGGSGDVSDYDAGVSVCVPNDGINYRLSDRINVSRFHLNQTDDIDQVVRGLDEPDYPDLSYEIDADTWYFAMAQKRASKVPLASEYTGLGNNLIDGDWYVLQILDTAYQFEIDILPHVAMDGRLDFYSSGPDSLDNLINSDTALNWSSGADSLSLKLPVNNYYPGTYFIRITHDLTSLSTPIADAWNAPYYFKVRTTKPCAYDLLVTGVQDLDEYKVSHQIISDATVPDSGVLDLFAGSNVELLPGFNTGSAAELFISIDTCTSP